jgi:hypothetical protein
MRLSAQCSSNDGHADRFSLCLEALFVCDCEHLVSGSYMNKFSTSLAVHKWMRSEHFRFRLGNRGLLDVFIRQAVPHAGGACSAY